MCVPWLHEKKKINISLDRDVSILDTASALKTGENVIFLQEVGFFLVINLDDSDRIKKLLWHPVIFHSYNSNCMHPNNAIFEKKEEI